MSRNRGTLKSEDCFGGSKVHTLCQITLVTPSESSRSSRVARVTHILGLGILVNFRRTAGRAQLSALKAIEEVETQESGAGDDAQTDYFFHKEPQLVDTVQKRDPETLT